jgi:hypothetical protein
MLLSHGWRVWESVAIAVSETALGFARPECGAEITKESAAAPQKKIWVQSTSRGKAQGVGRSLRLSLARVNGTDVACGHFFGGCSGVVAIRTYQVLDELRKILVCAV